MPPKVDIGILTIREDEFRAVLGAFPEKLGVFRGINRQYTLRTADAGGGARYTLAILRQLEQGNGEAQDAARDLLDDLAPRLILVVGIAGGFLPDDVTLGDVVISTRFHDFSVEARKYKEQATYAATGGPITKSIAAAVANLAGREDDLGNWTAALPSQPKVTWTKRGQLYGPKGWQTKLREKLEQLYETDDERAPTYFPGRIATSDRLVKDPELLLPLVTTVRNLAAVEMESGGIYRAARERCAMLAIRGISDIPGLKRSEAWTKYACASAAAFTRGFLRTQPISVEASSDGRIERDPNTVPEIETLYSNLIPLVGYPRSIFVAPATVTRYKQAWAELRSHQQQGWLPGSWLLYNKQIYSFIDPEASALRHIVDRGAIEENPSSDWAESQNPERTRLFMDLLKKALQDDLGAKRIRYFKDDKIFAFTGFPDEKPRKYRYHSMKRDSSITVVSHYVTNSETDEKRYKTLRHLAFRGRFRELYGKYYLEINPTYRYTRDGREKTLYHASSLSGIKRVEKNRAVLGQVRLWNGLIAERLTHENAPKILLRFGTALSFDVEVKPDEENVVFWDVPADDDVSDDSTADEAADDEDLEELEEPRL